MNILVCSSLWPLGKFFFVINVSDGSVQYAPESKIVVDIPTAVNFFGDPESVKSVVGEKVRDLVKRWNEKYSRGKEVYEIEA
jgi:hypothetical protein